MENNDKEIKDELNISVKKNGEIEYLNEDCLTAMTFLLKTNGEIGCSYFGVQSDEIIHLFGKAQKKYFNKIKQEFKQTKRQKKLREEIDDFNKSIEEQAEDRKN
ncbi:MAG: hypothetical protein ACI4PF_04595 [Christensenellales bacterium]